MRPSKRWNLAPPHPAANELAGRLKVSPLIAQILLNRGIADPGDCMNFLQPSLKLLHDPYLLPGLKTASERIAKTIRDKEKIVIYGDYDVDGITATAILWHAIRVLGGSAEYYLPHRIEEGYGLNAEALRQLCQAGAKLIISVDCGVTAIEPAKVAREHGVDLIITDHHEWKKDGSTGHDHAGGAPPLLPDCFTIVHPRLPGATPAYPNPNLCGAGVAFKLAWGIGLAVSGASRVNPEFREFLIEATALAALGTIADVVPLVGENRVLAHFGLSGLKASKLHGIQALIESANLTGRDLDSFHVGFLLAPRLNASGRMGHAKLAAEMLTEADPGRAIEIATYLESQNRARQAIEKQILEQALAQVETGGFAADGKCGIVVGDENWHPGVIGIVAARLVDRFHRPAIVVALTNGHGQGSGRSITGFHLAQALDACGKYLESHGGHEMAAGLKLTSTKFADFRAAFCRYAASMLTPEMLVPELRLDALADLSQISAALVTDLARLGPFGQQNRRPILCLRDLELSGLPRRVGKTGDHLQLHLRQGNRFIKCIAFGGGNLADQLKVGTKLDLAAEPTLNEYNGNVTVELEVKDIHHGTMKHE
jgi:single-stranded-DNA-specific exonuclease